MIVVSTGRLEEAESLLPASSIALATLNPRFEILLRSLEVVRDASLDHSVEERRSNSIEATCVAPRMN